MLLRMIGHIKVSSDRFRCIFVVFLCVTKVSRNRSPSRLPVSPMYNFVQRVQVMPAVGDIGRGRGKMIGDLNRSLEPRQFLNVANKRICFASYACAFESFGLITRLEYTSD